MPNNPKPPDSIEIRNAYYSAYKQLLLMSHPMISYSIKIDLPEPFYQKSQNLWRNLNGLE